MALTRAIARCTVKDHCSVLDNGLPRSSSGQKRRDVARERVLFLKVFKAFAMITALGGGVIA
jgi:hypothetical protein